MRQQAGRLVVLCRRNGHHPCIRLLKVVYIAILFLFLPYVGSVAGETTYTRQGSLACGDAEVKVVTTCSTEFSPGIPSCTEQRFTFTNTRTGEVVTRPASGRLVEERDAKGRKIAERLDALATGWACVTGKSGAVVVVQYDTGGNCQECQWFEINALNGERGASSRGPMEGKVYRHFEKTYRQLGLPKPWPKDAFASIPVDSEEQKQNR